MENTHLVHPAPPGTGVCHKKHRVKAPVVPASVTTPEMRLYHCNLGVLLFSSPRVFLPPASFSVHCSFDSCFSYTCRVAFL